MTTPVRLPDPLARVSVVQTVSPSMLAAGPVCALRRQGRELDGGRLAGLIESPWAIIGTLIHRSIQLADGRSNLREVFEELVRRRELELLADVRRSHLVPLRTAIGEGAWATRLHLLESRIGNGEPLPVARLDAQLHATAPLPRLTHEVWFESEALGLAGSADHVELVGEHLVRIIDWKTGSVLTPEGEVTEQYRLQLAAYLMLARERWPARQIETFLFNGDTVAVDVTPADEEAVLQAVSAIRAVTSGLSDALAADLALLGAECAGCPIRHRCPAYLAVLRSTGRGAYAEANPWSGDVLGRVLAVQTHGEMTVVNLRLPTGSVVQARWTSGRLSGSDLVAQELVAFGLIPLVRRDRVNGEALEPLMFEEVSQSRRAWQSEIFET
jgi:hypothetical protein